MKISDIMMMNSQNISKMNITKKMALILSFNVLIIGMLFLLSEELGFCRFCACSM
jgi:hypothetical protein